MVGLRYRGLGMILGPIMMIAVLVIVMKIFAYLLRALGLRPHMYAQTQ
jgi:hypothetical protein